MIRILIKCILLVLVSRVICDDDNDYYFGSSSEEDGVAYQDTLYDSRDYPLNLEGSLRQSLALLKKSFKSLLAGLKSLSGVKLTVCSRIYVSNNYTLNSQFKSDAKEIFKSTVKRINMNKPDKVARKINNWGNWMNKFNNIETRDFYTATDIRRVLMMTREGKYKYTKSDSLDCQMIELPYVGGLASFIIFLPNTRDGLPLLLYKLKLAPELMQTAIIKMRVENVILSIPKFKTTTELDLRVSYEKLGLNQMLKTQNSGLNEIVTGDNHLYVSKAIQKAVIDVNEHGTEAAAASGVEISSVALILTTKIFNANKPFYYFIKVRKEKIFTGIFVGKN